MNVDEIHFAQLRAQNQAEILLPSGKSLWQAASTTVAATVVAACLISAPVLLTRTETSVVYPAAAAIGATILLLAITPRQTRRPAVPHLRRATAIAAVFVTYGLLQCVPLPAKLPWASIAKGATILSVIKISVYIAFFWLVLTIGRDDQWRRALSRILFVSGVAFAGHSLATSNVLGWISGETPTWVNTGYFVSKNAFASYLGMVFLLGFAMYLAKSPGATTLEKTVRGLAYCLSLALVALALLATQSRLGIAGTGAGLIVYLSRGTGSKGAKLAFVILVAAVIALTSETVSARIASIAADASQRMELYAQVLELISLHPIAGSGLGTFQLAFEEVHHPPLTSDVFWNHAHSGLLQVWSEAGLVIGSLPVSCGALVFWHIAQNRPCAQPGDPDPVIGLAIITQVALHNLADFPLLVPANALVFLAITALICSSLSGKNENDR